MKIKKSAKHVLPPLQILKFFSVPSTCMWNLGVLPFQFYLSKCHHHHSPGGGHSHWKGVWGCAAVMTPFFQTSHRSLAYQFTVNAPLLCPLFSIFRKFLHFQPCFGQNSSSRDPNFSKFSFLRPLFFKENPLPRPYILKPAWHTSTKKKLSAPPPRDHSARF